MKGKKCTLAVGDGFNDVNMIQTSHVGIGIQGKESSQAAAFADYSIVKFKDLRRLIFWHGRSYAHKTLYFIMQNFWKVWSRLWIVWVMNSQNGMSAVNDIHGMAFALYPAFYMTWLVIWWNASNFDID